MNEFINMATWTHDRPPTILLVVAAVVMTAAAHFTTMPHVACAETDSFGSGLRECSLPHFIPVSIPHGLEVLIRTA